MAVTETDIEIYAARVRVHFPPELREAAFDMALPIARIAGPKAKQLRPETTLGEIFGWLGPDHIMAGCSDRGLGKDSLDEVESVMAAEEGLDLFVVPSELAARADTATFEDLVRHVARANRTTN